MIKAFENLEVYWIIYKIKLFCSNKQKNLKR